MKRLTHAQLLVLVLALLTIAISVITNFATASPPQWVKDYPWLTWVILILLTTIFALISLLQIKPSDSVNQNNTRPFSPYIAGPPIEDPDHFFGRNSQVDRFFAHLNSPQLHPLQVLGIRRSGKTSFLRYVSHLDIVRQKVLDPNTTLLVYVDLQDKEKLKTLTDFYLILAEEINKCLPKAKRVTISPQGFPSKRAFEKWLSLPQLANYRLVILLDEFEALREETSFDADFFKGLRSLVSSHFVWVTTSYRDLYRLSHILGESEKTSPFFNIFNPTPIILAGLTTTEADSLIQTPVASSGIQFSAEEVVSIQRLVGTLPFFLQSAADIWFDTKRQGLTLSKITLEVKRKFAAVMDRHFDWYWANFEEDERTLLARIATKTPTDWPDWPTYQQQYGDATLNDLINYGFIVPDEENYHIVGEIFAEWIRRRAHQLPFSTVESGKQTVTSQTTNNQAKEKEPGTDREQSLIAPGDDREHQVSQESFTTFLSYHSKDKPTVEAFAQRLIDAGIEPWLDEWDLIPGEPRQEAIEEALEIYQTVIVFLGPSGLDPWQNEEMRSALEERVRDKSRRVIPVLLPGAPDPQIHSLPRFLRRLAWVDFRSSLNDIDAFHRLVSGIKGEKPVSITSSVHPVQAGTVLPTRQQDYIISHLEQFNLKDETDPNFGDNDLTKNLFQAQRSFKETMYNSVLQATSSTIFLAIPIIPLESDAMTITRTTQALFQPARWYDTNYPGHRYHAREIFPLDRQKIRTTRREVILEHIYELNEELLIDTLRINQLGDVAYATSFHTINEFTDGPRIFRLSAIINILWSFLCLAWELYEQLGYHGNVHTCVAMINTKDTLLGHFAPGWPDPYEKNYRNPLINLSQKEVCRDLNILVCRDVDFAMFERKVEPDVLYQVAEEIALAYNQQEARCFEQNTRKLMEFKLHY